MVRERAEAEKAPLSQSPRFIAFASLSMPPEALKALVRDMGRAGGVTVLRGFPAGDSAKFKATLAAIWRSEERRVGKECVSTCRCREAPDHYKKKRKTKN